MTNLWDRRKGESAKAFAAFRAYRDLGPDRSFSKLGRALGKTPQAFEPFSVRNEWVRRCAAWDDEVDRRLQTATLRELEQMRARHIQASLTLQGVGLHELNKLVESVQRGGGRVLSVDQLLRVLREGTTMERLNRGQPGEIVEERSAGVDLSGLTEEDLLELRRLASLVEGGAG